MAKKAASSTGSNPTVVFRGAKDAVIEDKPMPKAGPGEILIQTTRSMISTGTELTIYSGEFPKQSAWSSYGKYPFDAGYSNVGKVVEVGEGVDKSWLGKRAANFGPHAAFVKTDVKSAFPIPDAVTDDQASIFTIGIIVMNGVRRSRVEWGESVAIFGMGLLGQLTARFCAICGARPVICIDPAEPRLKMLPKLSTIVPVNPTSVKLLDRVKELTHGRLADLLFEVTGAPQVIAGEFEVLRKMGRAVMLSSPRGPSQFDFHDLCNAPSYTIIGTHVSSTPTEESFDNIWTRARNTELFFDHIARKELDIDGMITHRANYKDATKFYQMLLTDRSKAMGVVFEW
ncbi:MAG TPA: zinc-binding dehydrogenase [Planctomycetota bacterium]|nr:zinc-binding dehydrogenase [Planctomycetota bacterium]